jgi:hypothetical protein
MDYSNYAEKADYPGLFFGIFFPEGIIGLYRLNPYIRNSVILYTTGSSLKTKPFGIF